MILFLILLFLILALVIWICIEEDSASPLLLLFAYIMGFVFVSEQKSNKEPLSLSDPIPVETSEEGLEIFNGEYIVYDNSSGIRETKKFSSFEVTKENGAPFIKEVQYDNKKYWYRFNITPKNHFNLYIPENTQFKLIEPQG